MAGDDLRREELRALLDGLSTLRVEGPSMGGPHVGVGHNELTREILAAGGEAVPLLVERLPGSGYDEAVYILFLLRELRAAEAEDAVRRLQPEVVERSAGRDLTLKMQVEYFLRDVRTW